MSSMTITEFLLARIADDEAVAHTASVGSEAWRLGEFDETVLWWQPSSPEKIEWNRERFGDDAAAEHERWGGQTIESSGDKIAPHIARHDPARVLAECEAKRLIIGWMNDPVEYVVYCDDVLGALASVYADHPDYRDEWKP